MSVACCSIVRKESYLLVRAMARAVSRLSGTTDVRARSQASLCGIYGGQDFQDKFINVYSVHLKQSFYIRTYICVHIFRRFCMAALINKQYFLRIGLLSPANWT
jgi:hypothetical protein